MKELNLHQSSDKLRHKLYDIEFGGCASKIVLGPFKFILRKIRAEAVKAKLIIELEKKSTKDKNDKFDLKIFAE